MLHEKVSKYVKIIMLVFVLYFSNENLDNYGIFERNFRYVIFVGFCIFFIIFLRSEEKNKTSKIHKISEYLLLFLFICMVGVKIYDFNVYRRVDKLCNHIEFNFNDIDKIEVEKVAPESDRKNALGEKITYDKEKINYLKNYICSINFTKAKSKSQIKDEKYLKEQRVFYISFINNKNKGDIDDNRLILEVFPNKVIAKGNVEETIYYSVENVLNKDLLWKFYDNLYD